MRINPSNTGNVRMQSLWHLGENLRLTFDPSYQYMLANGGGTTTINETVGTSADVRPIARQVNAAGFDLNGDGDILDTVRFYTPNTTNTNRYGATASLIWDLNDDHRMRLAVHVRSRPASADRPVGPDRRLTSRKTSSPAARASAFTPPTATSSAAAIVTR